MKKIFKMKMDMITFMMDDVTLHKVITCSLGTCTILFELTSNIYFTLTWFALYWLIEYNTIITIITPIILKSSP